MAGKRKQKKNVRKNNRQRNRANLIIKSAEDSANTDVEISCQCCENTFSKTKLQIQKNINKHGPKAQFKYCNSCRDKGPILMMKQKREIELIKARTEAQADHTKRLKEAEARRLAAELDYVKLKTKAQKASDALKKHTDQQAVQKPALKPALKQNVENYPSGSDDSGEEDDSDLDDHDSINNHQFYQEPPLKTTQAEDGYSDSEYDTDEVDYDDPAILKPGEIQLKGIPLADLKPTDTVEYTRERQINANHEFQIFLDDNFPDEVKPFFTSPLDRLLEEREIQLKTQTKTSSLNVRSGPRGVVNYFRRRIRNWRFKNSGIEEIMKYYRVERTYSYVMDYNDVKDKLNPIDVRPAMQSKIEIMSQTQTVEVTIKDRLVLKADSFNIGRVIDELSAEKESRFMEFFQKLNRPYLRLGDPVELTTESMFIDAGMYVNLFGPLTTVEPDLRWAQIISSMKSGIVNSNSVDKLKYSTDSNTAHLMMARFYNDKQKMQLKPKSINTNTSAIPTGVFQLGGGRRGLLSPTKSARSKSQLQKQSSDTQSVKPQSPTPPSDSTTAQDKTSLKSTSTRSMSLSILKNTSTSKADDQCQYSMDQSSVQSHISSTEMSSEERERESRSDTKTPHHPERLSSESYEDSSSGTSSDTESNLSTPTRTSVSRASSTTQRTMRSVSSSSETHSVPRQSTSPDCQAGSSNSHHLSRMNFTPQTNTQGELIRVPTLSKRSWDLSSSKSNMLSSNMKHSLRKSPSGTALSI